MQTPRAARVWRAATWLGVVVLTVMAGHAVQAQSIFTNAITDTNPSASNPYTTGQVVDPNLTVTGIGRGAGLTASSAANRYSASAFDTSTTLTLGNNDYFTFTLTPKTGYVIDLTSFVYTGQVSSGTPSFSFRSSADNFASGIGSPTTTGTTISLGAATYQNISGSIEFRFYGYHFAAGTTAFSINDFTFNGTVVSSAATANGNYFGTTGQGYNASSTVFDTTTPDFNTKNDGTGTARVYDSTQAAIFGGTAGTVTVASGGLTVGSGLQFESTGYTLSGGALTFSSTNTVQVTNGTDTATIRSPLAGSAGLTKTGAGTLVLTGTNGNTGTFTTSAGTLELNNGSNSIASLTTTGGTTQIDAGTTVTLTTGSVPVSSGAALVINGTLLNNSTTGLSTPSGTVTVASGGTVIQQGNGTPTAFVFSANTTFQPGSTLVFRDYTSSPAASNRTYTGNLTFDSSGGTIVVGSISGSKPLTVNGDLTIGAGVTLPYQAANTLTNVFNGNVTVNGNLGGTNGTQSFTIASNKVLFLGTGGVVNFAAANATSGLPDQTLTVSQGGTLMGVGTISGPGTTLVSGALSPGSAATTATITLGALTLDNTSTLNFNISSTTAKDTVDLGMGTSTASALTLVSGKLALALPGSGFDYTATYALFTNVSSESGSFGTVTGYDSTDYTASFALNGTEYDLSFKPTTVPEPATVLGGALLVGAVGWSQRRRLRGLAGLTRTGRVG